MKKHSGFIGFMSCPVCKQETRHYLLTRNPRIWATVYCEKCRVMRHYTKNELEELKK